MDERYQYHHNIDPSLKRNRIPLRALSHRLAQVVLSPNTEERAAFEYASSESFAPFARCGKRKMDTLKMAYFVHQPARISDLRRPHLTSDKRAYKIVKHIRLPVIDYVNFITDFYADRPFIEENQHLCRVDENGVWHCLLVTQLDSTSRDGVLVMSDGAVYPKWAAYVTDWEYSE